MPIPILITHFDGVLNPQLHGFPSLWAIRLRTFRVITLFKGIVSTFVVWKGLAVKRHIIISQDSLEGRHSEFFSLLSSVRFGHFDSLITKKKSQNDQSTFMFWVALFRDGEGEKRKKKTRDCYEVDFV